MFYENAGRAPVALHRVTNDLYGESAMNMHGLEANFVMGFVKAVFKEEVELNKMKGIEARGKQILIANIGGKFYAMGNRCTHMGCMISDGELSGENAVCPCHGSTFNVSTGNVVKGPTEKAEPVFEVKIEGDQILVNV